MAGTPGRNHAVNPPQATRSLIPGLDGLRALACLAVFGVHFHQKTQLAGTIGPFDLTRLLENGNTGVAVFFILSSFLLSLPYWSGRVPHGDQLKPWLKAYAIKRASRIVPAYYLCLSVLVVAHLQWNELNGLANTVLHYLFLHNFAYYSFYGINQPFWTIGIQVQFYTVFPILMAFLVRMDPRGRRAWVTVLGIGLGSYLLQRVVMVYADDAAVYTHSLLAHMPHFMLGILAGRLYVATQPAPGIDTFDLARRRSIADWVFWGCFVAVLIIMSTPIDLWCKVPFGRYNLPYIPVLITAMVVSAPRSAKARVILESFSLRGLGVISYGVYVYHLPCLNVASRLIRYLSLSDSSNWFLLGLIGLSFTIIVSWASYLLIERPIIEWCRRKVAVA